MNWTLPIGIAIGTFIGYFAYSRSAGMSLFAAAVAFVVAALISVVLLRKDKHRRS